MLKRWPLLLLMVAFLLTGVLFAVSQSEPMTEDKGRVESSEVARAIFAGGCFWCMESPFEKIPGVIEVYSGYTGGKVLNPTYKQVSAGGTGHTEAVEVLFDPQRVDYAQLLEVFWRQIDPTDAGGQFVDRGQQYRSGIYPLNEQQQKLAEASKQQLAASGRFKRSIVTEIVAAGKFYRAEEYHQNYYKKNPLRYRYYRYGSGRDKFLDRFWGEDRR